MKRAAFAGAVFGAGVALMSAAAVAQTYPVKPVRFLVGFRRAARTTFLPASSRRS